MTKTAKRISQNHAIGAGDLGFTWISQSESKEPVYGPKDHISCQVSGESDSVNASLGLVKAYARLENLNFDVAAIELLQKSLLNFGASIFSTVYATYKVDNEELIESLLSKIEEMNRSFTVTEFVLYGGGYLTAAALDKVTTEIRTLERTYVTWIRQSFIPKKHLIEYQTFLQLLNVMSKFTWTYSRYLNASNGAVEATW